MTFWNNVKANSAVFYSLLLIIFLWLFLSSGIFNILSTINELNFSNQQELVTNNVETMLVDLDQTLQTLNHFQISSELVTEEEFYSFCEDLCENDMYQNIFYAGDGSIDYVIPSTESSLVGLDVFDSFDDQMLDKLQTSIEDGSLFYQVQDELIVFYKPVILDDEFDGLIGVTMEIATFSSVLGGSIAREDIVFKLDNTYFQGNDDIRLSRFEIETFNISGLDFEVGTTYYSSLFDSGLYWAVTIWVVLTLFLFVIFVLIYQYNKENMNYMKKMEYVKRHHLDTGLKNREFLYDDFGQLVELQSKFYVAYGLFNNVKFVHYKYGHQVGSSLETKAIRLVEGVLRQDSSLYHLGGDEYVFIINTSSKNEAQNILNRVLRVFEREIVVKNIHTNISLSLGVVSYPDEGTTIEALIQNASLTLSQSAIRSTNNYVFYNAVLRDDLVSLQDFDNYVNNMNLQHFRLFFMPIASCQDNTIVGFECLSRAYNDFNEVINTLDVISSLERSGRIQELDTLVFARAIKQRLQWSRIFPSSNVFFSLNASALSLNETYVDEIIKMFVDSGLPHGSLILELTESYRVEDYDYLIRLFQQLNEAGIYTAIDDFGSGYSSLSYISRFPIYSIKLDKAYVRNYSENSFNRTLLLTMKSIADVLDCLLIAEGVDDPDTLDFLQEHGCPFYQGFLLSKGVPWDEAITMYKQLGPTQKE